MRESLGTLLVQDGVASDQDVRDAIEEGQQTGEPLGEVVIRKGLASERQVGKLLAKQWQLRYAEAGDFEVDEVAALRISREEAGQLGATPIAYDGDKIVMAIVEPRAELFAHVERQIGEAAYVVVSRSTFEQLIGGPLRSHRAPEEAANGGWELAESLQASVVGGEDYSVGDPVDAALASIDEALEGCERISELGRMLNESLPLVREQLIGQQSAFAALDEARRRDGERIQELEAELSRQGDLFQALRGQAAALAATFDAEAPR